MIQSAALTSSLASEKGCLTFNYNDFALLSYKLKTVAIVNKNISYVVDMSATLTFLIIYKVAKSLDLFSKMKYVNISFLKSPKRVCIFVYLFSLFVATFFQLNKVTKWRFRNMRIVQQRLEF